MRGTEFCSNSHVQHSRISLKLCKSVTVLCLLQTSLFPAIKLFLVTSFILKRTKPAASRASGRGFLALLIIQSGKMLPLLISTISLATSEPAAFRNFADTWSGKSLHTLPSSYIANPTLQHSLLNPQMTTGSISASRPKCRRVLPLFHKRGKKKDERRKLDTRLSAVTCGMESATSHPENTCLGHPCHSLWHCKETRHTDIKALKVPPRCWNVGYVYAQKRMRGPKLHKTTARELQIQHGTYKKLILFCKSSLKPDRPLGCLELRDIYNDSCIASYKTSCLRLKWMGITI